jgi:urease accessory protein
MTAGMLLLSDSRFPAGGHAHSGGVEPAVTAGGLAAAACAGVRDRAAGGPGPPVPPDGLDFWAGLDAEADARTPAPAQRAASRQQGRGLLRAARAAWPGGDWPSPPAPHHPVVLGAAAAAAGCDAAEAARIAAYQAVAGSASAAVRLLALDPMRAAGVLATLAEAIDEVAVRAAVSARGPLADLPYPSAPALDLLAEAHIRAEARLFES